MTTLYLLNRAHTAADLLPLLAAEDAVLLCGDAVQDWQHQWPAGTSVHVLAEDAAARNLHLPAGLPALDYNGFVGLCTLHSRIVAW